VDLTQLSEDEFLCTQNLERAPAVAAISAAEMGPLILEETGRPSFAQFETVRSCGENFRIIRLSTTDTGLIDRGGNLVGYYIGEALVIDPGPARGQKLSIPLILDAVPNRPLPGQRKLTPLGENALRAAWRVANGNEDCPW
jgi:hypothetical protein